METVYFKFTVENENSEDNFYVQKCVGNIFSHPHIEIKNFNCSGKYTDVKGLITERVEYLKCMNYIVDSLQNCHSNIKIFQFNNAAEIELVCSIETLSGTISEIEYSTEYNGLLDSIDEKIINEGYVLTRG